MSRRIDYGKLMHRAMRGLIQQVLADVAENGLPGDLSFFLSFTDFCELVSKLDNTNYTPSAVCTRPR